MNNFSFISLKATGYTQTTTYIIHGQICTSFFLFALLCLDIWTLGQCCFVKVIKQIEIQPLLVQTHLENQSRYHLQQSQRHQVKQYLTLDTKVSSQTLSLAHSHTIQPTGVTSILRNGHMPPVSDIGTPESPVTKLLALGGEHENAMEEVIEDIINMESSFNDEGIGCSETPLLMQRTVEDVLELQLKDCFNKCYFLSEADTRAMAKERQKKDNHNLKYSGISILSPRIFHHKNSDCVFLTVERRRRYNINYRIKELGTLIPKSNDP
ncbi:Tfec [Columba guinea]|nr:Tfec [Columba guinea]